MVYVHAEKSICHSSTCVRISLRDYGQTETMLQNAHNADHCDKYDL